MAPEGKCSGCKERKGKLRDGKRIKQKGLTACVFSQLSKLANSNSLLNLALKSSMAQATNTSGGTIELKTACGYLVPPHHHLYNGLESTLAQE